MRAAASQFLRAVRVKRSQVAFARRLGYRANPITDWENGRRFPTAAEALRACERVGHRRERRVRALPSRPRRPRPSSGTQGLCEWLVQARGSTPIGALAERCGRSRFAIARWLSGEAQPRLPDFFAAGRRDHRPPARSDRRAGADRAGARAARALPGGERRAPAGVRGAVDRSGAALHGDRSYRALPGTSRAGSASASASRPSTSSAAWTT